MDSTPKTIGLIGGTGKMGQLFARLFAAEGHPVLVAGRRTELTYEALVTQADVVIVTVTIDDTVEVIRRIGPLLRPHQLLSDFTSVKQDPVQAMLATPACVIGCHPIFGPTTHPAGQNVVLCPQRPGPWLDWYAGFFRRQGMKVSQMTPLEHDQAMAVVQGLTHFINIGFARTLQTQQVNLEQVLAVCSPVYRVAFAILSRILSGDPALYGQIQLSNRENFPVVKAFVDNSQEILTQVGSGDGAGFNRLFLEAADYLGDYLAVARQESDLLIEHMRKHLEAAAHTTTPPKKN